MIDVTAECEKIEERSSVGSRDLAGFWKEEHNGLLPTPDAHKAGVGRRARQYLHTMSHIRWMVIEDWDSWRFEAEKL